jgi:glycosyltransferase involved in cell wall biosynthesis
MNTPKRTIWMNVTTSAFWQRPPVGIVRVERSLNAELAKLYGPALRQCIWQGQQFVALAPEPEKNYKQDAPLTMSQGTAQKAEADLPAIYPILSKLEALKTLAQSLLSLMPSRLQPLTNRLLHALRPRFACWMESYKLKKRTVMSRQLFKTSPASSLEKPVERDEVGEIFAPGDILISVGLDWDHSYYKEFYKLRQSNKIKIVTCCYDLIPVLYPQYCVNDVAGMFTSYFIEIADGSDLILCISKQSQKDLNDMLERTGGARPSTHVFPLGDNVLERKDEEISEKVQFLLQQKFILFVSSIERRKNHEVLYRAYHLLCRQGRKSELPKLIFVGMPGWGVNELLKDIELDPLTSDMIIILNNVNDAELCKLYDLSFFCVFPSLYEGWGLPVGEALSLGKAVICSDRGSLPEVGGEAVCYVSPWSPDSWAENIYRMTTDSPWRNEWENKARKTYKKNEWSNSATSIKNKIDLLISNSA